MLCSTNKLKGVNSYWYFEQNLIMLLLEENYENVSVLSASFWYYSSIF